MKNRILTSCIGVCTIILLGSVILYIYVRVVDPNPLKEWSYVSLGSAVHVAVIKRWGCNLVFYNQELPYLGDIISVDNDKSISVRAWDGCGIYLRLIKNTDIHKTWWTFMISLWYPIIVSGIVLVIFAFKKWRGIKNFPKQ